MANSVHRDRQGPDWPLGLITVVTPGTQVSIMSLVDAASANAPETAVGGATPTGAGGVGDEYAPRAQQIIFQSYKAGTPLGPNTAAKLVYIVRKPTAGGGGTGDNGTIVAALSPGQTFTLGSAASNRNVFNPYRYFIDADTASDGCLVTLVIQ